MNQEYSKSELWYGQEREEKCTDNTCDTQCITRLLDMSKNDISTKGQGLLDAVQFSTVQYRRISSLC